MIIRVMAMVCIFQELSRHVGTYSSRLLDILVFLLWDSIDQDPPGTFDWGHVALNPKPYSSEYLGLKEGSWRV